VARRQTDTAEFFPHFVKPGRTLFILESNWGNDGYAFWFKLLELLCEEEGHFYDCGRKDNWEYLLSRTRMASSTVFMLLEKLAELGNLNQKLWQKRRIIWCQNLVDNLKSLYSRRGRDVPVQPSCISGSETPSNLSFLNQLSRSASHSSDIKHHSIEENRKEEKNILETDSPASPAVANRPIYHLIESAFLSQAPQIGELVEFNFKREGPHILGLEKKALTRDGPEEFAKTVIVVFWRLIHSDDQFWKKQPFLPSVLNSGGIWPRVLKEMENHQEEQLDDRLQEIIGGLKF